jgi:hypothetical protein
MIPCPPHSHFQQNGTLFCPGVLLDMFGGEVKLVGRGKEKAKPFRLGEGAAFAGGASHTHGRGCSVYQSTTSSFQLAVRKALLKEPLATSMPSQL